MRIYCIASAVILLIRYKYTLPHAPQNLASSAYPQESILCGCGMKVSAFFVGKECVRNPQFLGHLRSNGQCFYIAFGMIEANPNVCPELTKVEIRRKIL